MDWKKSEFTSRPGGYYDAAFEKQRIRHYQQRKGVTPGKRARGVDPPLLDKNHILEGNENIEHTCLLTEAVVPYIPVEVISESEDALTVCKPPGVPIYPQGPFESNSLTELLKAKVLKDSATTLHPISRLDRVTSGLVVLAKTPKACTEYKQVSQKFYILRWSRPWMDVLETARNVEGCSVIEEEGRTYLIVSAPIEVMQHEPGSALRAGVTKMGKESISIFQLADSANESLDVYLPSSSMESKQIIIGVPVTGRTHQLRVHSRYLNSPIPYDPLYDESHQRDTKKHEFWIIVRYDRDATECILSWLDIRNDVHVFSDPLNWVDLGDSVELEHDDQTRLPTGAIKAVYGGPLNSLRRESSVYPDFGMIDGDLLSFHPFVDPHCIALHSFGWKASGEDQRDIFYREGGIAEQCRNIPIDRLVQRPLFN